MIVGVIGLGSMGLGAAQSLLRAGIKTWGCDVNPQACEAFSKAGGTVSDDPAAMAASCDVIAVFVVSIAQVRTVLFESGAVKAARNGTVFLISATISPTDAEMIGERLARAGMLMIDGPVSGGAAKAASGEMTIMASGSQEAFNTAQPAIDAISSHVFRLGDTIGAGSRMKLVNQHLAGVHIAATAEAMTQAIAMGMNPHEVINVISACAGTSWMFENRAPHIADGDYMPRSAIEIWLKDLNIVLGAASQSGMDPVLARTALSQFQKAADAGLSREDDAAVAKVYARNAGLKLPGEDA